MKRRESKVKKYSAPKPSGIKTIKGNYTTSKTKHNHDIHNHTTQCPSNHLIDAVHIVSKRNTHANKENYLLHDEYSSKDKRITEPNRKKPKITQDNDHPDNSSRMPRHTLESKIAKIHPQPASYINILNTQHTESIMEYEEYYPEKSLKCTQELWSQKQTIKVYQPTTQEYLLEEKRNPEEEIHQFQQEVDMIQMEFESESMYQVVVREQQYKAIKHFPNYLKKKQPHVTWVKRAIVVNWMMEVMAGFGNKRETCAIAINYLDRYLALSNPIPLQKLQLLAGAAMELANKVEDRVFSVGDMVEAMGYNYQLKQLLSCEIKMVSKLGWKLHPPTSVMWANRLCVQWDQYTAQYPSQLDEVKFRTETLEAYTNYRELMEYIDLTMLQIHTLQYHCRQVAASLIYMIICMRLFVYSREEIGKYFPYRSAYLLCSHPVNNYYNTFLLESFGLSLNDLLPTIQYCSTFLTTPISLELPSTLPNCTLSQYCSYQTYNEYALLFLHQRDRTIY